MPVRDVLIVGAGPSGLATAIAAKQQGLDYAVVEKGVLVDGIFNFPTHMVFFTTPELLEIGGLPLVTPYDKPTRLEALRYYRRVVDSYGLQIAFHEEVVDRPPGCELGGDDGSCSSSRPRTRAACGRAREARAVVLAIGYYDHPELSRHSRRGPAARLALLHRGASVLPPARRHRRRQEFGGRGGARALPRGRLVTLVHRHATLGDTIKYWVQAGHRQPHQGRIDCRSLRDAGRRDYRQRCGRRGRSRVGRRLPPTRVFLLTGYQPDVDLMRRAGVLCDEETLAPDLNPETFETNVPESLHRGRRNRRTQHRLDLHRERPLPRRADHQGARRASAERLTPRIRRATSERRSPRIDTDCSRT